jgi:hypothetical protein
LTFSPELKIFDNHEMGSLSDFSSVSFKFIDSIVGTKSNIPNETRHLCPWKFDLLVFLHWFS